MRTGRRQQPPTLFKSNQALGSIPNENTTIFLDLSFAEGKFVVGTEATEPAVVERVALEPVGTFGLPTCSWLFDQRRRPTLLAPGSHSAGVPGRLGGLLLFFFFFDSR